MIPHSALRPPPSIHLLLVDDKPANLMSLEAILGGLGYHLVKAGSGEEALRQLLAQEFAVILLDVQMPGLDGFETARLIRARESSRLTPIIFLTAEMNTEEMVVKGYSLGAVAYLIKPLVPEILRAKVAGFVERKQIADALRQSEQQMRLAGEELMRVNQHLVERNTEIRNFYHTLSHELKTPLTSAREFISILMDGLAGPLNETQMEYLGIAKDSCDQLRLHIDDLLDVTRLETGKMRLEFRTASLTAQVQRVVEILAPAAAGKGVRLSCDCPPDLPAVPFDQQRIQQVLTNLATNAIKFTPAGGEIRLCVSESRAAPKCLQVAVSDTGRGIPKDELGLIFHRLHQAHRNDASAESRSGLGLGLYLCQELVQLHGGHISVESEVGRGSTFTFTIPKRHEAATVNVLVVDDDASIRDLLARLLEKAGYQVTLAGGGAEALGLMRRQRPVLVILDLAMPGLDGAQTLVQIRNEWPEIPVVIHTGYPEGDLMNRALDGAPFTVLAKPAPPEQMLSAVRTLARRNSGMAGRSKATRLPTPEDLKPKPVNAQSNGLQLEP